MTPVPELGELDRDAAEPLHAQVARLLQEAIDDGRIPTGSRLAGEVELAERWGLSRPTVRRGIQALVDRGLLVRRRRAGTQVVPGRLARGIDLTSLYDDLRAAGRTPATRVLEHGPVPASDDIAAALGVGPGEPVLRIRRLRTATGQPIAVMENHLPGALGELTAGELEHRGLYELLADRGIVPRVARQWVTAGLAAPGEARLLGLEPGAAVLVVERTAYDSAGRAIEFGRHRYRADVGIEVTLVGR